MRQMHVSSLLLLLLVLLVASFSVVVVSGEVLALDGICGGATPCECGDILIASRTLVSGVDPITTTVCPGDGLSLEGGAFLDLGGNTIRGTSTGVGVLIVLSGGFTITNGRIARFAIGIRGSDTSGNHFTGLQLSANSSVGISLGESNGNVIARNVISRMTCGRHGIAVSGGRNEIRLNRVEFNSFAGFAPAGIHVGSDRGEPNANSVSRNVVRLNKSCGSTPVAGLTIQGNGATVELNRSEDNDGDGFVIDSVDENQDGMTVVRNIALRNGENGFRVSAPASRFDGNRGHYNKGFGFLDASTGGGTGGTANTYTNNLCRERPRRLDAVWSMPVVLIGAM